MKYTRDNPKLVTSAFNFKGIETFTGVAKSKDNTIVYYLNGKHHRENGPAVTYNDGDMSWSLNGKYHREDGPAIERAKGTKYWYLNGERYGIGDDFTNESWIRFVKLGLLK